MNQWDHYTSTFGKEGVAVLDHAADLYRFDQVATGVRGFDAVDEAALRAFHEQGYLVIHDAFNPQEVNEALEGLLDLIDGRNPEYKGLQFEKNALPHLHTYTRDQKQDAVRKVWKFVDYDARLKALSAHPRLTGVISRLMQDTPVMFQDMAMLKPPRIGREKPWHQDCAYFNFRPGTPVVGTWIALDEATAENGCMHVIPGSHKEGAVVHFSRRDWQICDTQVKKENDVIVPLKPGGLLLFHGLLHHGTPTNQSAKRRRAIQLHYRPEHAQEISLEERLAIFGPEGKDVEC